MSRTDFTIARQRILDRRLDRKKDAEEQAFWHRQLRVATILNCVTGVGAVVSFITVIVLLFTLADSRKATEEAGRAWLAPIDQTMDAPPKVGEDWTSTVHFRNVGKGPALKFKLAYDVTTAPGSPDLVESGETRLPNNDTCGHVTASENEAVVYTEHEYGHFGLIRMAKQDQNAKAVLSKKTTLVSVGCLAYQTFDKPRTAAFCYYLRSPEPPQHPDWHWCLCPKGNTAA